MRILERCVNQMIKMVSHMNFLSQFIAPELNKTGSPIESSNEKTVIFSDASWANSGLGCQSNLYS